MSVKDLVQVANDSEEVGVEVCRALMEQYGERFVLSALRAVMAEDFLYDEKVKELDQVLRRCDLSGHTEVVR